MNNALISVIVPVYNCEKYIAAAIGSITGQTYRNIEIIVVDDGSTDDSGEIVKKLAENDERIVYVYQKNAGVSAARNKGISLASGDYIGFADGDDLCEPRQFELLLDTLTSTDADIAVCSMAVEYADGTVVQCKKYKDKTVVLDRESAVCELFSGVEFAGHCMNKLFGREAIRNIAFNTGISICEDLLFCTECFIKSSKIAYTGTPLYHYYVRSTGTYYSFDFAKMYTAHISYTLIEKELDRADVGENIRRIFYRAFLTNDYQITYTAKKGFRKSPEYREVRASGRKIYRKIFSYLPTRAKISFGLSMFFTPLYRMLKKGN